MAYITKQFGPVYPKMELRKHRNKAAKAGSIAKMAKADLTAYANAIYQKINALNKLRPRETQLPPAPAASGTRHTEPAKILAAVRSQQTAKLNRQVPAHMLPDRTAEYERIIAAKRANK